MDREKPADNYEWRMTAVGRRLMQVEGNEGVMNEDEGDMNAGAVFS